MSLDILIFVQLAVQLLVSVWPLWVAFFFLFLLLSTGATKFANEMRELGGETNAALIARAKKNARRLTIGMWFFLIFAAATTIAWYTDLPRYLFHT
jgi:hypothetical protein